jgi:hypothetical protein
MCLSFQHLLADGAMGASFSLKIIAIDAQESNALEGALCFRHFTLRILAVSKYDVNH